MNISDNKDKKGASIVVESVESGEILSSGSEWKIGSDKLFVICLNCDSENKIGKPSKTYLDLFINTSLNLTSTRSRLVS